MSAKKRVLFVCTGNTCRSPLAEGLFASALQGRTDFEASSAGVAAYPGQGMSPESAAILKQRGIELPGFASRPVDRELLEHATHVFAMTQGHLHALEEMFPDLVDKFFLVTEFADIPGHGVGADVPDPIGMGRRAYREVAEVLEAAIPGIIAFIDQTFQVD
jgi:protein-tyrosine-phosphatase